MRRQKQMTALLVTFAMAAALLAGCGGSGSSETTAAQTTAAQTTAAAAGTTAAAAETTAAAAETTAAAAETTAPSGDPISITMGVSSLNKGWPESTEEDFAHQAILDKLNIDVQFIPIDEYYTSLNVQLTGGTAPDFFEVNYRNMKSYAEQGLIRSLQDWKDDLAPVFEYLGPDFDNFTLYVDDEMYALPNANAVSSRYYLIYARQDFLDALGMEAPTTVDELFDFCQAASSKNLSGQGNTIGLGGKDWYPYNMIASTYGVHLGNYIILNDEGKVDNMLFNPHMEEALTAVKRFNDAGLIDPDAFNAGVGTEHMQNGLTAIGATQWVSLSKKTYMHILTDVKPDAYWSFPQPLKSNIGDGIEPFGMVDYNYNNGAKFVANETTSDEKIDALVRLANYLATDEGKMLSWMGIQGTHWDYDESGTPVTIEGQEGKINYLATYQIIGRNDPEYLAVKFPEASEPVAIGQEMARVTKYNDTLDIPDTFYYDDMNTYVNDQLLAFVKGDRPISEYRDFIQELYDVYDMQTYLDLATEQLTAMGIVK